MLGWKKPCGNLHLGGLLGYSSLKCNVSGYDPPSQSVCEFRKKQENKEKSLSRYDVIGAISGENITPCLPGMRQFQTIRLTEPSGRVSGLATKP